MKVQSILIQSGIIVIFLLVTAVFGAHPINNFYSKYKNDKNMESRTIPPKLAALFIDKDYPDAIDVLKSMYALKYLNFSGDQLKVKNYATKARLAKGDYERLLEENTARKKVDVFGLKKRGFVRRIIAIVEFKDQFLLVVGKGKLSQNQLNKLPALAEEL